MISNKVQLIGNVGQEPETKSLNDDKIVVRLSLATNEYYKDQQGNKQQKTEWHQCCAFGGTAKIISKYVKAGSKIAVEGKLQNRNYTDQNGTKKYVTEILIEEVLLLDTKSE